MPYKDPQKQKEAQHRYYVENKEKYKEASKRSKPGTAKRRTAWMQEVKSSLKCKICGEDRYPCLDFHHRIPTEKEFDIGPAASSLAKNRILKEIEKCDVLCRNCHAFLHWEEKQVK